MPNGVIPQLGILPMQESVPTIEQLSQQIIGNTLVTAPQAAAPRQGIAYSPSGRAVTQQPLASPSGQIVTPRGTVPQFAPAEITAPAPTATTVTSTPSTADSKATTTVQAPKGVPFKEPSSQDLARKLVTDLNATEGQLYNLGREPFRDEIIIGPSLNLTVQTEQSLTDMFGKQSIEYKNLSPLLGKKYSELTPKERQLQLSPESYDKLSHRLAASTLRAVEPLAENMGPAGKTAIAQLHHWGGPGFFTNNAKKLLVTVDGQTFNPFKDIGTKEASDADVKAGLLLLAQNGKKQWIKNRAQQILEQNF